jgi:hypothetical protein
MFSLHIKAAPSDLVGQRSLHLYESFFGLTSIPMIGEIIVGGAEARDGCGVLKANSGFCVRLTTNRLAFSTHKRSSADS